jgi:hypothetical protein
MTALAKLAAIGLLAGIALFAACTGVPESYACKSDEQCRADQDAGLCELDGFCSHPDSACPTGRRYVTEAGKQSDQCVAPWLSVFGGPFSDTEPLLALDRAGHLHLGVSFVDQTSVGGSQLQSAGLGDFYLARLEPARGRVESVEPFGGAGYDELHALARYGSEDILLAGSIDSTLTIDGVDLTGPGMVVARRGVRPWAHVVTATSGYLYTSAISEDGSLGRVVISGGVGSFDAASTVVEFGVNVEGDAQVLTVPSTAEADFPEQGFVAMYEGDGRIASVVAARPDGSSGTCQSVAVDPNGVLTASCMAFDADDLLREDPLGLAQISASWYFPELLSEFESNELTSLPALAYGPGPALFLAGTCYESCLLPAVQGASTDTVVMTNPGALLVARATTEEATEFDPRTSWVGTYGPAGVELYPSAVAPAPDGRVYVTGGFEGSGPELASAGQTDVFVATFGPDGQLVDFLSFGGTGEDWGNSIVVGDDGAVYVAGTFREEVTIRGQTFNAGANDDVFVMRL